MELRARGDHLFDEFKKRACAVSAEVYRVRGAAETDAVLKNLVVSTGARKIAMAKGPLLDSLEIERALQSSDVEVVTKKEDIASSAADIDMGISEVEFGIAETGSLFQDAWRIESRLVSILPPLHVAVFRSNAIVTGIEEALEMVAGSFDRGYIGFITGPSRTADIERVLTIGVHGPSRLVIIAVDEDMRKDKEGGSIEP